MPSDRGVSMHVVVWVDGSSPVRVVADLNSAQVVIGEEPGAECTLMVDRKGMARLWRVAELVTDPGWVAECDQLRAALHRTSLPVYGGQVRHEIAAARLGGAR